MFPAAPALAGGFFTAEPPGEPTIISLSQDKLQGFLFRGVRAPLEVNVSILISPFYHNTVKQL